MTSTMYLLMQAEQNNLTDEGWNELHRRFEVLLKLSEIDLRYDEDSQYWKENNTKKFVQ